MAHRTKSGIQFFADRVPTVVIPDLIGDKGRAESAHRLRRLTPRNPSRENAAAQERAFERAVAVHAAAAEARDLARRIDAGQRLTVGLKDA